MQTDTENSNRGEFVVFTSLGYLSLALHHWVFLPDRGIHATDFDLFVMLLNLAAGGYCFWRGFQGSIAWWRSISDG